MLLSNRRPSPSPKIGKRSPARSKTVFRSSKLRLCLVCEMKIFGCHIGCFGDVGRGFRILIKKTHYIARLKTARRIY